jgi:amino acid adenylation domain-containing protein
VGGPNLAHAFEAAAARWPDRPAVVDVDGLPLTYADLNRRADALARFFAAAGVRRGDRIGLVLRKSPEAITAMLAALKCGAAYVPVDVTAPVARTQRLIAACDLRAVVGNDDVGSFLSDQAAAGLRAVVGGKSLGHAGLRPVGFEEAVANGASAPPLTECAASDDVAYIIHTSGSTGEPKGVMITHRNAVAFVDWCAGEFAATPDDRFSGFSPLFFDPSVVDVYVALVSGASVHLISDEIVKSPKRLAAFVSDRRLTVWTSTPSALMMLMQFGGLGTDDSWCPRLVAFGGEVFPVKHLRALKRCWPAAALINMYGPTETTTACTFAWLPAAISEARSTPFPIGRPCSHCRALVLDDDGREVGQGGTGELHIGGPSVFPGYWRRPEETAAAFLERDGTRWYRTGDLVRIDPHEGLVFAGRRDRMIKRRGFRIELAEIERALLTLSSVVEVAAVATPSNDGATQISAFVVLDPEAMLTIVDLKTYCARTLPAYMTPDRFVIVDSLVKTATAKVDHAALGRSLQPAGGIPVSTR